MRKRIGDTITQSLLLSIITAILLFISLKFLFWAVGFDSFTLRDIIQEAVLGTIFGAWYYTHRKQERKLRAKAKS